MPPIRLALCITDLDVGGAERCMQQLAVGLDRDRFDPVVYCLGPRPSDPGMSCVEPIEAAGIPVHCLGGRRPWHLPITLWRLRRLLTSQRPEILQTFLFHANFTGRLAAWRVVPHVVSGLRVAERQAHWHLWLDRWTQTLVERHVCVSRAVADFSTLQGRLRPDRLVVIPNGFDPKAAEVEPIDLGELGISQGRRAITFIGRLEPQKGLPWLLETAVQWLPHVPDCDLLLVGSGRQREELVRQSQELNIADRVHLVGWRADTWRILAGSHLLVLPSRWEGMPNVVLQAMAVGLPVLATHAEGTQELLGDQSDPQTAPYGATEVFSEKLFAMMSDADLAERLGHANRDRAHSEFTVSQMIRSYETLWESLARG